MRHPISGFKVQTGLLFACDAVLMGGRTGPVFRGVDGPVRRPLQRPDQ